MQDNNFNPNIPYYPYPPIDEEQLKNGGYPVNPGQPAAPYGSYVPGGYPQEGTFDAQGFNPYDVPYADGNYGARYGQPYDDGYAYQSDPNVQPPYQQGGYNQYAPNPGYTAAPAGDYYPQQGGYQQGAYPVDSQYGTYPQYNLDYTAQIPFSQINAPPAPQGPNSFERTVGSRFAQPQVQSAQPQIQQAPVQQPQPAQPQIQQAPVQPPQAQPIQPQIQQAPVQQPQVQPTQPQIQQAPVQPPQVQPIQPQIQQAPVQPPQVQPTQPQIQQAPVQPPQVQPTQPQIQQAPVQQPQPVQLQVQQAPAPQVQSVQPQIQQAPVQQPEPIQPQIQQTPVQQPEPIQPQIQQVQPIQAPEPIKPPEPIRPPEPITPQIQFRPEPAPRVESAERPEFSPRPGPAVHERADESAAYAPAQADESEKDAPIDLVRREEAIPLYGEDEAAEIKEEQPAEEPQWEDTEVAEPEVAEPETEQALDEEPLTEEPEAEPSAEEQPAEESPKEENKPEDIFESFGIDLSDVFAKRDELAASKAADIEEPAREEFEQTEVPEAEQAPEPDTEPEPEETAPEEPEPESEPAEGLREESETEAERAEEPGEAEAPVEFSFSDDAAEEAAKAEEPSEESAGSETTEAEEAPGEETPPEGEASQEDVEAAEPVNDVMRVAEELSRSVLAKSYSKVFTENNLLEPEDGVCLSAKGITSDYFLMRNGNQPYHMYNNVDITVNDGSCVALVSDVQLASYALAKSIGENADYGDDSVETSETEDGFEREVLYIGNDAMIPEDMTSLQYLMFSLKNVDFEEDDEDIDPEDRYAAVLSQAGLGDIETINTSELSHNKRVLLMALSASLNPYIGCLIINDPNFKVGRADEMSARRIFAMLHDRGKGVLLASTTPLLMGAVANRVVALRSGKVAFDGSFKDFLDTYCLGIMSFSSSTPDETVAFFIQKYENVSALANGNLVYLIKKHTGELDLDELLKDAIENGADSRSIVLDEKTFEIACKEVLRGI